MTRMFDRIHKRKILAATGLVVLLYPAHAEAHLVTTGLGPVYDGIGHFFLSPADVLSAIALALLAGLRGTAAGRRALFFLPVAWLAGGLIGLTTTGWVSPPEQLMGALSLLLLGILVAADFDLPVMLVAGLAVLFGAAHGFFNGLAMREAAAGNGVRELIGVAVTLFVLMALASAAAVKARPVWARIVCRVAGSWIAASGLLWAGWTLRGVK
jgi:hydrogenase/urease accessory protein HupE